MKKLFFHKSSLTDYHFFLLLSGCTAIIHKCCKDSLPPCLKVSIISTIGIKYHFWYNFFSRLCFRCLHVETCHLSYLETSGQVCSERGEGPDSISPSEWVYSMKYSAQARMLLDDLFAVLQTSRWGTTLLSGPCLPLSLFLSWAPKRGKTQWPCPVLPLGGSPTATGRRALWMYHGSGINRCHC